MMSESDRSYTNSITDVVKLVEHKLCLLEHILATFVGQRSEGVQQHYQCKQETHEQGQLSI